MKILILFAHPAFQKSHVNRVLIQDLSTMEGVTFHDLYEEYPEFDIDVKREQELLVRHDCIIFHHPFFWYSSPAILKEWQDLVLEHGWAYGSKGNALSDKLFINVITTGGPQQAYKHGSSNNYSMLELLSPFIQTANLCKMLPLPPFVVHGTHGITKEMALDYKQDYHKVLKEIIENKLDPVTALQEKYLNDYIKNKEVRNA